jgi:hypothetical protein
LFVVAKQPAKLVIFAGNNNIINKKIINKLKNGLLAGLFWMMEGGVLAANA